MESIGGLTNDESARLVSLLRRVRQPYTRSFTEALAGVMPVVTAELVVMGRECDTIHVLLTERPLEPGDPWAGAVHIPGSIVRNSDANIAGTVRRLAKNELGIELGSFQELYWREHRTGARACTFQHVFYATVDWMTPSKGTWYSVNELPDGLLPLHRKIIATVQHMVLNDGD